MRARRRDTLALVTVLVKIMCVYVFRISVQFVKKSLNICLFEHCHKLNMNIKNDIDHLSLKRP